MIAMDGLVPNYGADRTDRWVDDGVVSWMWVLQPLGNSLGNWEPMQGLY